MARTLPPTAPAPPCVPPAIGRAADAALFQQLTRWVFWLCLILGGVMLAAGMHGDLHHMPRGGFVIEKPFKPNELLLAVRQALDSTPAAQTFHSHH